MITDKLKKQTGKCANISLLQVKKSPPKDESGQFLTITIQKYEKK